MTRILTLVALATSLMAGAAAAHPSNALSEAAKAGTLTPHGVWDSR